MQPGIRYTVVCPITHECVSNPKLTWLYISSIWHYSSSKVYDCVFPIRGRVTSFFKTMNGFFFFFFTFPVFQTTPQHPKYVILHSQNPIIHSYFTIYKKLQCYNINVMAKHILKTLILL